MSAWIVSKKHIDLLVAAAKGMYGGPDADQLGQMLWEENTKSVNFRYNETRPMPSYKFVSPKGAIDPVVVLKQISCFEYQACEHPEWKDSKAKEFCEDLTNQMIGALPGYEEAPWGV
jgi:hypothetical protein